MTRYSVQPRDQVFVKSYRFLAFARNMKKNICKNISKNLRSKYSKKLLHHAKTSATDALKIASKRAIQKTAEATGGLVGKKIADKITKVSKSSPQNSLETVESETENTRSDIKIPTERYISPKKKTIINDLRLT